MPGEKFSAEPEEQTTGSVFDFLYHDGRRVASFLAQFDPSGSLTQVSSTLHAEQTRVDTQRLEGSVGPRFAKGAMSAIDETRSRRQDDMMRVYDPMWANARALLDLLDERGMIQRRLSTARMGQIVLIKGTLGIYDLGIMAGFWGLGSVKKLIAAGTNNTKLPRSLSQSPAGREVKAQLEAQAKAAKDGMAFFMEIAPSLPHSAHASLVTDAGENVWCNISTSGLSMSTSDILLKHGINIPGEWAVLGIMDASPDPITIKSRDQTPDGAEMVAKVFETLAPVVRQFLGRPETSYGITPLLIFRETTPVDETA